MGISDGLSQRLAQGEVVILDGGVSTELQRCGVPVDPVAWLGRANFDHGGTVQALHEKYIAAGAQVIIANTHSTSRAALEPAGLGHRVADANRFAVAAALRAREAAATGPVAVAGSISSFIPAAMGSDDHTDLRNLATFREQAAILADSGVDLIALEMMDSTCYGMEAIEAATGTGLPVWLGISPIRFPSGRLGMYSADAPCIAPTTESADADSFDKLVEAYAGSGARLDAVILMHVKLDVIREALRIVRGHFPGLPAGVYAEVGEWRAPSWVFDDEVPPSAYLKEALGWADAGVQLIGGCCGTGPDYIRALAEGLPDRVGGQKKDEVTR
jgi:S-methylmethionine-dependent homocysteine/selenocysteine methylase